MLIDLGWLILSTHLGFKTWFCFIYDWWDVSYGLDSWAWEMIFDRLALHWMWLLERWDSQQVSNGETQGGRGGNWVHQQSYVAMIRATIRVTLSWFVNRVQWAVVCFDSTMFTNTVDKFWQGSSGSLQRLIFSQFLTTTNDCSDLSAPSWVTLLPHQRFLFTLHPHHPIHAWQGPVWNSRLLSIPCLFMTQNSKQAAGSDGLHLSSLSFLSLSWYLHGLPPILLLSIFFLLLRRNPGPKYGHRVVTGDCTGDTHLSRIIIFLLCRLLHSISLRQLPQVHNWYQQHLSHLPLCPHRFLNLTTRNWP